MTLNDLVGKYVNINFINSDKIIGRLDNIDTELNVIHIYTHLNKSDLLIPLYTVKSITENYT